MCFVLKTNVTNIHLANNFFNKVFKILEKEKHTSHSITYLAVFACSFCDTFVENLLKGPDKYFPIKNGRDDPWVGKVVSIELGELYATQCKDLNISRFSYFFFFFFFF